MQQLENQLAHSGVCAGEPIDGFPSLSDSTLAANGLVKVSAFVRSPASANAARLRRAKRKANENGAGQVNVVAPIAAHRAIKAIARALQEGRSVKEVLESRLVEETKAIDPTTVVRVVSENDAKLFDNLLQKISGLRGWRRFLARLIGIL